MKKIVSAILAIILSLSLAPSVFADHSISNVILESGCPHDQGAANQEGYRLITATGDQYTIQMPAPGMYFYTPESMYVDAEMNHSIYVYQKPDGKKEKLMPTQQSKQVVMTKMNKKKEKAHAHAIKQVSRSGEDNQKKWESACPSSQRSKLRW